MSVGPEKATRGPSASVSETANVSVCCIGCGGDNGTGIGRGMGMGYKLPSFRPAHSHVPDFSGVVRVECVTESSVSEESAAASVFNWALLVF